jgi:TRAP transporter 4TM/12TM fusion protein
LRFLLRFDTWFSVGCRRRPKPWLARFATAWGVAITAYVIYGAVSGFIDPWEVSAIFLSAIYVLVFLMVGPFAHSDPARPTPLDWIMAAASLVAGVYFALEAPRIVTRIPLLNDLGALDLAMGSIMFFLTLEATRRSTGLGLTAIVLVFVAYNFLGHLIGGILNHGYIGYEHFIDILVFTTDGIFGLPVRVAATYAFLFVFFGTVLSRVGGSEFFYNIAAAFTGRSPGGPAKIAVVSSGLYGMISGSPTADVVTTGSITIPMMKKLGYGAALAGAVEVAASTGGSIMPPVMGSAAFIMAEFTGIPYADIAFAALLPALLFYLSCYAQVHLRSLKLNLRGVEGEIPRVLPTLRQGGLFIIPLAVLTAALLLGYSATMTAIFGTVALLAAAMVKRESRIGLLAFLDTMSETAMRMVPVAGAVAAAGLVIAGLTMTGLAAKFAHLVYGVTDAQLFPSLLIGAALTILLGMGMPTPSAYILAAILMGPVITKLGVPVMAAHMFLLYYAVMSAITPPVAVAAYAAASIAEDNPLVIAGVAVKLALAAFIVPFAFIYGPSLLLIGSWMDTVLNFVTAAVGVVAIALAVEGHWRAPVPWWSRLLFGAGGLALVAPGLPAAAMGIALCAAGGLGLRLGMRPAAVVGQARGGD